MNLGNKSSLEFKTCLLKLQKYKHKIRTVSDCLMELTNDPDDLQNILAIYTQQDFRVIEISKSVSNYNGWPLKFLRAGDEQFSVTSYTTKAKLSYHYEKPNFPSLALSKASSETSETSYISVTVMNKKKCRTRKIESEASRRMHKKKVRFVSKIVWTRKVKKLDEQFEELAAFNAKIDESNRSKFESNCWKNLENIEQKQLEKHNSLEGNTLKYKEKLTNWPKSPPKSPPKPNKSNTEITKQTQELLSIHLLII